MEPIYWEIIGILLCLVGSAFFSGSETALTSLTSNKAQQLVDEGGAGALQLWLDRPIPVLTTILIGNNIVNVAASALATDVAHKLLADTGASEWAIPAAVGVMTFLLLTFGEITPKAIAKRLFVRVSMWSIRLLVPFYYLFWVVTQVFVRFTRRVMRLLGNEPSDHAPYVTFEEIEYLINLGSREGTLTEDRERLLRSVVDFPDTLVKEVMVPRTDMIAIERENSFDDILQILHECGHSRIPVHDETVDNIVGMFYAKDIIQILLERQKRDDFNLSDHLREPYFVPESKRIAELLGDFQRQRIHIAIVVDEFGGTAGIITLEDIIEEILGDIQDEYDTEPIQLVELTEHRLRADARVPIYEVESYFGMDLPDHPDYESLGGFVLAQSGSVPDPGDVITWDGLEFKVLEADAKKVITVEIERVPEPSEAEEIDDDAAELPEEAAS